MNELLELAVLLHTQGTVGWLRTVGAPLDLASQAVLLATRAAQDRDTPAALGLATASTARVLIMAGAFDLAQTELDSVTVPTTTSEGMQLAGFRALRQSVVAAADCRPSDVDAPLSYASELAERTGEGDAYHLAGVWTAECRAVRGCWGAGSWRSRAGRVDHRGACIPRPPTSPGRPTTGSPQAGRWRD
ncbi:MAG: hypothetical protein M3Z25_02675 [Actinomycetota bacterium]|nr:hypothetical protein [Actinomycetota bacterium]